LRIVAGCDSRCWRAGALACPVNTTTRREATSVLRVFYVVNGADSVERLCELLRCKPLDRRFEGYGCGGFSHPAATPICLTPSYVAALPAGARVYHGNFETYSAAFSLVTDEADVIGRLDALIAANRRRPDYRSQVVPDPEAEERGRHANVLAMLRYRGGA
jgi:hypothetical protein